ncbi:MAG: ferrous iron transport protein A [Oscillospiraceae bacterium]|nr:ferrous iron transport protein A [Oscillospiraceae bacterium]
MNQMKIGSTAVVKRLDVCSGMRRRLQDLGLIENTCIECLLKSPFGDPCAYLIRGAVIAIRSDESSKILIY